MTKRTPAAQLTREIAAHLANPNTRPGFRPIGVDGDAWPTWIGALKHSSGAYVIRDLKTHQTLYVGSARQNLYDTVTRHFQSWRRSKKFWRGAFGRSAAGGHTEATDHDPGMTYSRSRCEVAVYLTSKGEHLEEEAALIQKLKPRDNLVHHPDGDDDPVPF